MLDKFWDFLVESAIIFFIPLVCSYMAFNGDLFFNVACEEATGLELVGNVILAPCHYLLQGRSAKKNGEDQWSFTPRFEYPEENFAVKVAFCAFSAIPSFIVGSLTKAAALSTPSSRIRHREMAKALRSTEIHPNAELYHSVGINTEVGGWQQSEGHKRRPGDEKNLSAEKEALRDIAQLLTEAGITWWVDCGTCLGAYRYGGVIPWDEDLDVAILLPDFENVCHALNKLDPMKYLVQNWSSRDIPNSYLKIFVRKSSTLIDIYHFSIDPAKKEIAYILSLENSLFFPEWWKVRERRFKVPVSFDTVFPLKKAVFDGIEVFVPNDSKKYLQRYYGENLAPAKIYNPSTNRYEKDLSHPYWQRAFVH
jgi:hypothetical protein